MKSVFRIFEIIMILTSFLGCSFLLLIFGNSKDMFEPQWKFWTLELLVFALMLISIAFGLLILRPNIERASQLVYAAVIVLSMAILFSSEIKREYQGWQMSVITILAGFPVILSGLFSSFSARKDLSVFYNEFKSKLNT